MTDVDPSKRREERRARARAVVRSRERSETTLPTATSGDLPTYRPAPVPLSASPVARRIIAAANLVPAGRWVTYGDLAEAVGSSARGVAASLSSVTPLRQLHDDVDDISRWLVPWHRIRLEDGRSVSRAAGAHRTDSERLNNLMLTAEGGIVVSGRYASTRSRFDLRAEVRRLTALGDWP
jgi:alkylated DNA nucleotide flippase Atl1